MNLIKKETIHELTIKLTEQNKKINKMLTDILPLFELAEYEKTDCHGETKN